MKVFLIHLAPNTIILFRVLSSLEFHLDVTSEVIAHLSFFLEEINLLTEPLLLLFHFKLHPIKGLIILNLNPPRDHRRSTILLLFLLLLVLSTGSLVEHSRVRRRPVGKIAGLQLR